MAELSALDHEAASVDPAPIHVLPTNSSHAESPAPEVVKEVPAPKTTQADIMENGSTEFGIRIEGDTQRNLIDRLTSLRTGLQDMRNRGIKLSPAEEIILQSKIIESISGGSIGRDELGIAWNALQMEQAQKSMAVGLMAKDKPAEFDRIKKGFFRDHKLPDVPPGTDIVDAGTSVRIRTDYIDHIGYQNKSAEDINRDLESLNNLRLSVEQSLFEDGYRNPLFEDQAIAGYPLMADRSTNNRMQQEVYRQTQALLKEKGFEGRTLGDLFRDDPALVFEIAYEANSRALPEFARETGKNILKDLKTDITKDSITGHLKGKGDKDKETDKEQLAPFTEKKDQAINDFQTAETTLTNLKNEKESIEQSLPNLKMARDRAQQIYNQREPELTRRRDELDAIITNLTHDFNDPAKTAGLSSKEAADFKKTTGQTLLQYDTLRQQVENKLDELREQQISTAVDVTNRESRLTEITTALIPGAQTDVASKKSAKEAAEAAEKTKSEELEKGSPEVKDKNTALEKWAGLLDAGNLDKIIDARFSQSPEGQFVKSRLASIAERDGQIDGAEAIREHLFQLIDPTGYNPELARKMISDETIARAIMYQLQINPATEAANGAPGVTIQDLLSDTQMNRGLVAGISPSDTRRRAERNGYLDIIRDNEKQLLQTLLPRLKNTSEFEVGDLVRFLAHEGLHSAANGGPFLDLTNERFQQIREGSYEATQTVDSIIGENVGTAKFAEDAVAWEGKSTFSWSNARESGVPLELTTRISEEFNRNPLDRESIDYEFAVKVDQRLLQVLPEQRSQATAIPEEVRQVFYDSNGNLRQELRAGERFWQAISRGQAAEGIPSWIIFKKETLKDRRPINSSGDRAAAMFYDRLDTRGDDAQVTNEAKRNMAASITESILKMSPAERQRILRGVSAPFTVAAVRAADTGIAYDYEIDIDNNGNIMIGRPGGTRSEIGQFYQQRLLAVQTARGTTNLSDVDRVALKDEYMATLSQIGRQILIGQERTQ